MNYLKRYKYLANLVEEFYDPVQTQEWNNELNTIKSNIEGAISNLLQAIEAANNWKPEWNEKEVAIEEYPLYVLRKLEQLKKDAIDYTVRNDYIEPGSKYDWIIKGWKISKQILSKFHDLITRRNQFGYSQNIARAVQDFYLQHIEPLILLMQQTLDNTHSAKVTILGRSRYDGTH